MTSPDVRGIRGEPVGVNTRSARSPSATNTAGVSISAIELVSTISIRYATHRPSIRAYLLVLRLLVRSQGEIGRCEQ
jgi:hypothetical protein